MNKIYVGSAVDLSRRLRDYFNLNYLERAKSMYICNALLYHGYSAFSLTILEYVDITNLSKDESKKLLLEREQHFMDSLAPEPQGGSIPFLSNVFNIKNWGAPRGLSIIY